MSDSRPSMYADISFVDLLEMLWRAKWSFIVITTVSALIGFMLASLAEKSYAASTTIKPQNDSVFIEFMPLNSIINRNAEALSSSSAIAKSKDGTQRPLFPYDIINSTSVFEAFIKEFNDRQEMAAVIAAGLDAAGVDGDIRDANPEQLAKQFKIAPPAKAGLDWVASFTWHDASEGKELFRKAILLTLENTKSSILSDVVKVTRSLAEIKAGELERLEAELHLIEASSNVEIDNRLQVLRMHSAIAKDLGIARNQLTTSISTSISSDATGDAGSGDNVFTLGSEALYLRGFQALDKEIALTESLTKEQRLNQNQHFIVKKSAIERNKSDVTQAQIMKFAKDVEMADTSHWVDINLSNAEIKSNAMSRFALMALAIITGLLLSAVYVVGANEMRKRRTVREPLIPAREPNAAMIAA